MTIRGTWKLTPGLVKFTVVLLFALGAAVTLIGFMLVDQHWWSEHSFALNLSTALVGFCFGAPIAVVALAAISSAQQRNAELAGVDQLTERTWERFTNTFRLYVDNGGSGGKLVLFAGEASEKVADLKAALNRYGRLGVADRCTLVDEETSQLLLDRPQPEVFSSLVEDVRRLSAWFDSRLSEMSIPTDEIGGRADLWHTLCTQWEFIDTYLRARRVEIDATWFTSDIDGYFRWAFSRDRDMLARIGTLLRGVGWDGNKSLYHELRDVRAMTEMGELSFLQQYHSRRNGNGETAASQVLPGVLEDATNLLSGVQQTLLSIHPTHLVAVHPDV